MGCMKGVCFKSEEYIVFLCGNINHTVIVPNKSHLRSRLYIKRCVRVQVIQSNGR